MMHEALCLLAFIVGGKPATMWSTNCNRYSADI